MSRRARWAVYGGGYSRSVNAEIAEDEGRMPLTRAKVALARQAGITRKAAATYLKSRHDGEWHHVGRYASQIDYYDVAGGLKTLCVTACLEARIAESAAESRQLLGGTAGPPRREPPDAHDLCRSRAHGL